MIGTSPRRYYLLKARAHEEAGELALAAAFRGKALAYAGTPLPATFPHAAALATITPPYITLEDLRGATVDELVKYAGLARHHAAEVIAAIES